MRDLTAPLEMSATADDGGPFVDRRPAALWTANKNLVLQEEIFRRLRVAAHVQRALHGEARPIAGGIHVFPAVVLTRRAWAADVTHEPGVFAAGTTWVDYVVHIGTDEGARTTWQVEITGRFCVVVSDSTDARLPAAVWQARTADSTPVDPTTLPWFEQLPQSVHVPLLTGSRFQRAIGRLVYDGEEARGDLIRSQRGLVTKVINQFKHQLALESRAADLDDLEQVGMQRLLELATRRYSGAASERPATAAWSKVAMREIGNAIKSEIAAVTGISIEFRQLLSWFRMHPADRNRPAVDVAFDMAVAAGVTRLLQAREAPDRARAEALLHELLASGVARYLPPGLDAEAKAAARAECDFVISPRSSLAEIERAQRHSDLAPLSTDAPAGGESETTLGDLLLVDGHDAYGEVDVRMFLDTTLAERGLTPLEAAVWTSRTGVLGGGANELPEIADDLGLDGRAEARAALRRAWRKLDAISGEPAPEAVEKDRHAAA